ncbi:RluA family pseudouridine synthase, partial [bacterium]|nr:RluA family pseudouridine synthase [bacterium]
KSQRNEKPVIIYEDDSVVLVNKPAGYLVIPDHWDLERANLKSWVQAQMPDHLVSVVCRIDTETSGITLFAKNSAAHEELSRQLEIHQIKTSYLALVTGVFSESSGTIDSPIGSHPSKKRRVIIARDGKPSVTNWLVAEAFRNMTLLNVMRENGRTHQIRIHLQSIGHALAVDSFYGTSKALYLSQFKRSYRPKSGCDEKALINRLTLHALEITFTHPESGEVVSFECGMPKDMQVLLKQLRKYAAPAKFGI